MLTETSRRRTSKHAALPLSRRRAHRDGKGRALEAAILSPRHSRREKLLFQDNSDVTSNAMAGPTVAATICSLKM